MLDYSSEVLWRGRGCQERKFAWAISFCRPFLANDLAPLLLSYRTRSGIIRHNTGAIHVRRLKISSLVSGAR